MGHWISTEGVEADQEKVRVILECPLPTNVRELCSFLGLTSYYRQFVLGYGQIARPLHQMIGNDAFKWIDMLVLPDFSSVFVVEIDASGTRVGAVLTKNQKSLAFFSKMLSARAQAKSAYERELMDVVIAIQRRRSYLLGHRFIVRTDQQSLKYIFEQKVIQLEYQN